MNDGAARVWQRLAAWPPPFAGWVGLCLLLALSQTPSLLPRHWVYQGVVGGVLGTFGYGLGLLVRVTAWRLPIPELPSAVVGPLKTIIAVAAPVGVTVMVWLGIGWQRELHAMVGQPMPAPSGYGLGILLSLAVAAALIGVARILRQATLMLSRWLDHILPTPAAHVLGGLLVALLVIGALDGVVIERMFATADESFALINELIEEDVPAPASPLRSGSPESLVSFEDLGRQGRAFVTTSGGTGGTPGEHADPAQHSTEPIRVYAGLGTADDAVWRAELVVRELERTGGFDRSVLVVMAATGTGRINPKAIAAIEAIWDGDTALASAQYSYLPSPLSFIVDSERGRETGAILYNTIYERWAELDDDNRPLLLVFGESLGADGAEAAFSGIADLRNRTDGALFVGPPSMSELWSSFTERRDPGSPQRLPVFDGGATVRFANHAEDLDHPDAPWYHPRVIYLQHPSDPVVWWTPRLALRRPDWLREPRGDGILPATRWFPVVTFLQVTADLLNEDVPDGYGHRYGSLIVDAWVALAAPDGWTAADTARIHSLIEHVD